jgi:hypothetical protein
MSDTVQVDFIETFRLLTPINDPDLIVIRIETSDGVAHNFGVDRASFSHTVAVWHFDLNAVESAIATGAPLPGKPFGTEVKQAS